MERTALSPYSAFAMSAVERGLTSAIAFQVLAALDAYETDLDLLLRAEPGAEAWEDIAKHMDQLKGCSASVPGLSVPVVELLISHAAVVYALWHRARIGNGRGGDSDGIVKEHRACIASLRRACMRHIRRHS